MQEKNIKISESLGGLMEQMDNNQINMVRESFAFYMEQYENLRLSNNAESVSSAIHDTVSEAMNEGLKESEHKASCGRGCSFCCFQMVEISDDEATLILSYTKEIGFEIDYETLKHQQHAKDDVEFGILPLNLRRCVFLNKENECSIYEHRPSSCRKLAVMTPANLCDTEKNKGAQVGKIVSMEAEIVTASS